MHTADFVKRQEREPTPTTTANNQSVTATTQSRSLVVSFLCELLLDKEGPKVRQLPGASDAQHGELDHDPPHHAAVGALGLVAELGFAFLLCLQSIGQLATQSRRVRE